MTQIAPGLRNARRTRLIAALDTSDEAEAIAWARAIEPHADAIKLGLEFTYAHGLAAVRRLASGRSLFLDLKLHDIPNTVAGSIEALASALSPVVPAMLTIHAQGGRAMIEAASLALRKAFPGPQRPLLLAVTVLTSLDAEMLHETGIAGGPRQQALRLGALAMRHGADGLVCSAHEIAPLRDTLGDAPILVVPGVRPEGAQSGDQKRVMTPAQASAAGADWIVVGRPITRASDPARAAAAIAGMLV